MERPNVRENERLIAWLRAHSGRVDYGDQCGHHPPIREMTWSEIAQATDEELGRPYTRQWLQPKCKLLGIETRGRKGLRPWVPPEVQRARGAERWRRWWRRKTQDPEGLEEYYAKRRKNPSRRRRRARLISGASAGGQRYGRSDAEDECIKASLSQEVVPPLDPSLVDRLVRAALEEDGAFRDVTPQALVPPDQRARGVVLAKGSGVVAGLPVATAAFAALDATVRLTPKLNDGDRVESGSVIAAVEGPLAPILSAERVALNFLQRLSGVATATRALVDAGAGPAGPLADAGRRRGARRHAAHAARRGGGHDLRRGGGGAGRRHRRHSPRQHGGRGEGALRAPGEGSSRHRGVGRRDAGERPRHRRAGGRRHLLRRADALGAGARHKPGDRDSAGPNAERGYRGRSPLTGSVRGVPSDAQDKPAEQASHPTHRGAQDAKRRLGRPGTRPEVS